MNCESVSSVVNRIKEDLQRDYRLQNIAMEGNIIGLKQASNGHWYMNIRDDNALNASFRRESAIYRRSMKRIKPNSRTRDILRRHTKKTCRVSRGV